MIENLSSCTQEQIDTIIYFYQEQFHADWNNLDIENLANCNLDS